MSAATVSLGSAALAQTGQGNAGSAQTGAAVEAAAEGSGAKRSAQRGDEGVGVSVRPSTVVEGLGAAVVVTVVGSGGEVFAEDQEIELSFGGTATASDDYAVHGSDGAALSAPYGLVLAAGQRAVWVHVQTVADAAEEPAETLVAVASRGGEQIGSATLVIEASPRRLELGSLRAEASGRDMWPAFDPAVLHYAVGCTAGDTVTLSMEVPDADVRLAVDGVQRPAGGGGDVAVELADVGLDADIEVELANSAGDHTVYTVHCTDERSPLVSAERRPGSTTELVAYRFRSTARDHSYLQVIDANGVPRWNRRVDAEVNTLRTQDHDTIRYTYFDHSLEGWVLLDGAFGELGVARTSAALWDTDDHDFFVRPNGNFVFIAYEPAYRYMSEAGFGSHILTRDSVIEETTGDGTRVFYWNSYHNMYVGDCRHNPGEWAHLNWVQPVGDDYIASFRRCSQVWRIDGTTGEPVWILGRSNRSANLWEAFGDPAPLSIVGDPHGEFCGQHSSWLLDGNRLVLFDNGSVCHKNENNQYTRTPDVFSRVVEYEIDPEAGEARFVRHYVLPAIHTSRGMLEETYSGNWLISSGKQWKSWDNPHDAPLPEYSIEEYNPDTARQLLTVRVTETDDPEEVAKSTRAFEVRFDALEDPPGPLTAQYVPDATVQTHSGPLTRPEVVVAFSRPVVDFAAQTASATVAGARIDSVAPYLVDGAPANAYRFTLLPDGPEAITFQLVAGAACGAAADSGICTKDRTRLSEVPAALTIASTAATGAPTITGTAQVGETITADTSTIADPDGLTGAVFAHQWARIDGATGTDAPIAGATGADYTLSGDDQGHQVKVEVSFTDDAGNPERLVSAPVTVAAPAPVWVAEMAAGGSTDSVPGYSGYSLWGRTGSLSTDRFEAGSQQVRVAVLAEHAGGLNLVLSRAMQRGFALIVGDSRFDAAQSLEPPGAGRGRYWWPLDTAPWSAGDTVDVSITLGGGPLGPRGAAPPWATLGNMPAAHDGAGTVGFDLFFSDTVEVTAEELRDHVLDVTGAAITAVTANRAGDTTRWRITVAPAGTGDIHIAIARTADCQAAAAVCTPDGRKLHNSLNATIPERTTDFYASHREAAESIGGEDEFDNPNWPRHTLTGGVDYHSFTLTEARTVGLGVRRFSVDLDLYLEDANGNVIASSTAVGSDGDDTQNWEFITAALDPGDYYIRVQAADTATTATTGYILRWGP